MLEVVQIGNKQILTTLANVNKKAIFWNIFTKEIEVIQAIFFSVLETGKLVTNTMKNLMLQNKQKFVQMVAKVAILMFIKSS